MLAPSKTPRSLRQNTSSRPLGGLLAWLVLLVFGFRSVAATFTNSASIQVNDPGSSLTSTGGTFTVSCWFRISIPSSLALSDNMDILMDRSDGNESANFSYLLRYNYTNGTIEFVTHGASGTYSKVLIQNPYLERWYHVAVTRTGNNGIGIFTTYVDGRALSPFNDPANLGNTTGSGLAIGGVNGTSRQFYGDVIEVAIYNTGSFQLGDIQNLRFADARSLFQNNLKGYYKLGYSTNIIADFYHNFATNAPAGTDPAVKVGTGNIGFEQTDQAGEQSAYDSRKNHGDDALTPLSGAFTWQQTTFARPVPGIAFDLRFGYSSGTPTGPTPDGAFDPYDKHILGLGWRNTFDTRLFIESNAKELKLMSWDGSIDTWSRTNTLFAPLSTRSKEYRGELVQLLSGDLEWTNAERLVYHFRDPTTGDSMAGRLLQIRDFNNNSVQLNWDEGVGLLTNIVDTVGGSYQFNYDSNNHLTNIAFGQWQVNFGYDTTNHLTSKSLANTSGLYANINTTWQFRYNTNGLLSQIIDPRGNTNVAVQYDQYGRQTNEVDALNRGTGTEYDVPTTWQMRRTDPGNSQWIETYDYKGHILAEQDPLTNTTSYTYDTNGNRTSIMEPLGWTTSFGYDNRANVIAKTNALNEVTRWVIHPFFNKPVQQITAQPADANGWTTWTNLYQYDTAGNLTNHYDVLGSLVSYSYYTNGLVFTSTDANGHTTTFTYDTNGFLYTQTDPVTNTTTFFRNDVGWKQRELNAFSQQTTYGYDLNGNVTRILDALTRVFYRGYDENGNLLSVTDGKGKATTYAYDAANQKTNMIDRTGTNVWQYFYTLRGKLDHVTDPLNDSVTNVYDADNRLFRISDPLGHWVTNQYDANGNLTFFFDKLGKRWSKTYDRLDRLQSEADPLGNTKQMIYDVADRIYEIISPNTYPSFNTYDGRGRLTTWVDPQNYPWHYDYDGVGNITNITDALQGHYIMAYGPRNERKMEQNQDTNIWQYTYDELLRIKQQTDPNQVVRTATYDAGGRLRVVDLQPTGREDTYDYDDNDNMRLLTRRDSGGTTSVQLIYDTLDRIQEEDEEIYNANNQTVLYGHDPLGRVTTITYPGNFALNNFYDALGRLTNQVDRAGRQMSYTYDLADRLQTRRYPSGVVQTNGFDDAGRLTGLSYASPNISTNNSIQITLSYAYDSNGNKSGGGESGTFNWPLPSLTDDNIQFTAAGRLKSRQIQNNSAISNQLSQITYNYDANGNMTNAVGSGQSWTLTYDEDNRTTSINWDCGLTSKSVTNRYDAFGRRISKTVDGVTTGYVLDLSGGMERVLCDLDGNGNVAAWYVHGPDLCYRVDSTNGLLCYHADAMGNIIALTDGNANLVAQYAYTPYGRSLGSTNFQSQISNPYLFVGSQGVMEESDIPNLYFMRARYYSADADIFLSTDPVKRIGPGWKPTAYGYVNENPLRFTDPKGEAINPFMLSLDIYHYADVAVKLGMGQTTIEEVAKDEAKGYVEEETAEHYFGPLGKDAVQIKESATEIWDDAINQQGIPNAIETSYMSAIYTAGNALGNVLYNDYGLFNTTAKTLTSPTAGTTPMAILSSGQSAANTTATIAAPKGAATTVATSTKPSGATGGGATTSSGGGGGGGSSTYVVKPGDTLGNIGYANGTTATAIGAANGIQNLNVIHPGQVLTIPHR